MNSGITKQALVRHRWSLLGPACTQMVGAAVIGVMMMASTSVITSLGTVDQHSQGLANTLDAMSIFRGNARFLSIIVVGVTMSLATYRQMHDMALMRSIGSTPAQMRWCLVRQAMIVSVPATLVGFLVSIPMSAIWLEILESTNVLPHAVQFHLDGNALLEALKVETITSLIGTLIAVIRPSLQTPAKALVETNSGRGPIGRVRVSLGFLLVIGGVVLSAVLSQVSANVANAAGIFILLGESVGVGLLGPLILRSVVRMLTPVMGNGLGRLALDELTTSSRALSGALIPLVLSISFALIQDGMLDTQAHVTGFGNSSERIMTFSGTTTMVLFAGVAALNCLMTIAVGQRRNLATMTLIGADHDSLRRIRWIQTAVFATTALLIATAISLATLVPIVHSAYGSWIPDISSLVIAFAIVVVGGITALGTVVPANAQMKRQTSMVLASRS